ncbi:MAG: YHS domain-containing protein [Hyphomicrobiales bacterium]|nr:YHS domain-containing protein [Hyphomicrobiales bacterium]
MMRFGCGSHVLGHGHGHRHGSAPGTPDVPVRTGTAKDPVCGMTVDTAKALSSVHSGQTYYFCSETCRDRFVASPEKFVGNGNKPPSNMETSHGSHQH